MQRFISITALLIGVAGLSLAFYNQRSQPKIGYVHNARLLSEYQGMKEAQAEYQAKMKMWQANLDTLQSDVSGHIRTFSEGQAGYSADERRLSAQLIDQKKRELLSYKNLIEEKAALEEEQMIQSVLAQIDMYVLEFGKSRGYDFVFGVTENGSILYARDAADITESVLLWINKKFEGEEE